MARALEIALDSIRADRVRTRAAVVALAIAMVITVCLTTLVERGRASTIRALERAGLKNLYMVGRPGESTGFVSPLSAADVARARALTPVRAAARVRTSRRSVTLRGVTSSLPVYAVAGSLAEIFGARARAGRLLSGFDSERKTPYGVVGSAFSKAAGSPVAIGDIVSVEGRSYEIVGQLEDCGSESASVGELPSLDWNRALVVPLGAEPGSQAQPDVRYPLDVAALAFTTVEQAKSAAGFLEETDPERYLRGPVRLVSPIQTLRQYRQTRRTFDRIVWLVLVLTGASAAVGVSNLLSASVIARSREIGLRRAVGARSRDIVLQFRAEGVLLAVAGGGLGLAAGLAASVFLADRSAGGSSLPILSIAALAGGCLVLGVLTGIRPSLRASRIDPAQALREG
jgi:putative ABC transport system permease protein